MELLQRRHAGAPGPHPDVLQQLLAFAGARDRDSFTTLCANTFPSKEVLNEFIRAHLPHSFMLETEEQEEEYDYFLTYLMAAKTLQFPPSEEETARHTPQWGRPNYDRESLIYQDFSGRKYPNWPQRGSI